TAQEQASAQVVGHRFGWITGLEVGAIVLVVVVLNMVRRPNYILTTVALIVGLHFFPLASLFNSPLYYVTAVLGCAIAVGGYVISDPKLRASVVGGAFGLLLWVTVAAGMCRVHARNLKPETRNSNTPSVTTSHQP